MTQTELYEAIVSEVNTDKSVITFESSADFIKGITGEASLNLDEVITLKAPLSAFAEIPVRDLLMVDANADEQFAYVLVNKISATVTENIKADKVSQFDIEALACASQITAMWEQPETANAILEVLYENSAGLHVPSLALLTKRSLTAGLPYGRMRKEMGSIRDSIVATLDK